jgi:hypothetical protein
MELLAKKAPRESAGATTLRAFDFQIHVSMDRILEAHKAGKEFVAIFDHQDDLVLVEGDEASPEVSFFQVKSSLDKAWTAARLAQRPTKGEVPKSIVGKSYYNFTLLSSNLKRVSVLSNQPLHATLNSGEAVTPDHGEVQLFALSTAETAALLNALHLDFPGQVDTDKTNLLTFERVPLDLQSYRDTIFGRIAKFAEAQIPGASVIAKPFYDAFLSEAGRCTGNATKPTTFDDLKMRKGIARGDIDDLVKTARQRTQTVFEWWSSVEAELSADGLLAIALRRVRVRCIAYWQERQRGNSVATELCQKIRGAMEGETLPDKINAAITFLTLKASLVDPPGAPFDVASALIVEIMEPIE